jgi:hypothetical protein
MDSFNALLTSIAQVLLGPFRHHATAGLVFWSVVTGIVMTYVFGKTSNQRALRQAADRIRAQLFAIKLFKDDLRVTLQCQLKLLKATGLRLLHSLTPMLVMLIPLLLVLVQLAMRYEYQPLVEGERAVVALHVKPDQWDQARDAELRSGPGYLVETEALRDERNSVIYWRVRADARRSMPLEWSIGNWTLHKQLPIAAAHSELTVANPKRAADSFWDRLLYPAEASLPADQPIESIDIQLTPRATPVLGLRVPWWGTFFLVSVVVAFVTGKLIGVQY